MFSEAVKTIKRVVWRDHELLAELMGTLRIVGGVAVVDAESLYPADDTIVVVDDHAIAAREDVLAAIEALCDAPVAVAVTAIADGAEGIDVRLFGNFDDTVTGALTRTSAGVALVVAVQDLTGGCAFVLRARVVATQPVNLDPAVAGLLDRLVTHVLTTEVPGV
jgi:hypothetical protein